MKYRKKKKIPDCTYNPDMMTLPFHSEALRENAPIPTCSELCTAYARSDL